MTNEKNMRNPSKTHIHSLSETKVSKNVLMFSMIKYHLSKSLMNAVVKITKISPMRSRSISDIRKICNNRQDRCDFDDMGFLLVYNYFTLHLARRKKDTVYDRKTLRDVPRDHQRSPAGGETCWSTDFELNLSQTRLTLGCI
jgi:hypothetical protein